jgi:hypothetical protein
MALGDGLGFPSGHDGVLCRRRNAAVYTVPFRSGHTREVHHDGFRENIASTVLVTIVIGIAMI